MMDVIEEDLRLIDLFRQKAADIRAEAALRTFQRLDEETRHRLKVERRKEEEARELEDVIATTAQLAAFDAHLDDYDTATVHALMGNQHALDLVFKQREDMESAAFRLPDGHMAFKSEDGRRVFDQRGVELGPDTIHPNEIPDAAPTWEAKRTLDEAQEKLVRERDALHDYQKKLDEAREAAGKGDVTADALAKMEAKLQKAMPDAVKAHLPGAAPEPDLDRLPNLPPMSPTPSGPQALSPAGP